MTTFLSIIKDALIEAQIIDPTMPIEAPMADHAARVLNRMLDSWSTEDLMVYTENRNEYPLVIGTQVYELGPDTGAAENLSTIRPANITRMSALLTASAALPPEVPLHIMTTQEWQAVCVKQVPGGFPTGCWTTGDFPTQKLWMWPIPNIPCSIVIYSWGILSQVTSLTDIVQLPKGYEEALVYNLAIRLASPYGQTVHPATAAMAQQAKARIRELNNEPIYIGCDSAVLGGTANSIAIRSFGIVVDR